MLDEMTRFTVKYSSEIRSEVLRDLSSMHRLIGAIATGGGVVIRPINWSYMKKGLTILLDVLLDAPARRIAAVRTASRPPLASGIW
nr:shikimate kinase 3, chloroplastic-like isoform X2 [Lolium perenne]